MFDAVGIRPDIPVLYGIGGIMISEKFFTKLSKQVRSFQELSGLKIAPGCYNVILRDSLTQDIYETQGDIPGDPEYTWDDFCKWLSEDIKEMGIEEQMDNIDIISIEYAGFDNYCDMMNMTVYRDSTDLFADKECDEDNLITLEFPTPLVKEYFDTLNENGSGSFEDWIADYSADDTSSLYDFARSKGFFAKECVA